MLTAPASHPLCLGGCPPGKLGRRVLWGPRWGPVPREVWRKGRVQPSAPTDQAAAQTRTRHFIVASPGLGGTAPSGFLLRGTDVVMAAH